MIKVLAAALVGTIVGIGVMVIVIVVAGTGTSGASSVGLTSPNGPTVGVPSTTVPNPSSSVGPTSGAGGATGAGGSSTGGGGANLQEAAQLFTQQGCAGCHTFAPANSSGNIGPEITLQALQESATKAKQPLDQYVETSIKDPNAYVVSGFKPGVMPTSFGQSLSSQQIADLVAYLTQK